MDADVIVVGAGPTGLMLAGELGLAGVRTLVLERRREPSELAKAGGLAGQVLPLLHYRGELERFREASPGGPERAAAFPFGGLHLDFTRLPDPPMKALLLPQPRLEGLLAERALERGAGVRRGHEVVALDQDEDTVTVEVRGPDGPCGMSARYVVGCDGGRSRVRSLTGIPFPGTSLPEIERLASFKVPDSVTVRDDGGLEVAGVGTIPFGYTATESGVFACAAMGDGTMGVYTAELQATEYDDDVPMTAGEVSESVRRVLGVELPLGDPLRLTRFGYSARQADRYRDGRVFLAGDAAHLFPAGGVAITAGMLDAANLAWKLAAAVEGWAPSGLLDTYADERRAAAERTLLHTRAQVALRRGYGPGADALRALFLELTADEQPLRRLGALMAGMDAGAPPPKEHQHRLVGTFVTDQPAGLLSRSRPVLVAERAELREVAAQWSDRVDVTTGPVDGRAAEALLILPDAQIAWAAAEGAGVDGAADGLRTALDKWCGAPGRATQR